MRVTGRPDFSVLWRDFRAPAEPFNAWSHLLGAAFALGGTIALLPRVPCALVPGIVMYGLAMVGLFFFSAATHAVHDKALEDRFESWDRAMIYLLIAGTYTPLSQRLFHGAVEHAVLLAIWLQALAGIAVTLAPIKLPRFLGVSLYLAMGWTVVLFVPQLWDGLDLVQTIALIGGAFFYTAGAVVYALERPNPWPTTIGHHGLWHSAVLLGALSFFVTIWRLF